MAKINSHYTELKREYIFPVIEKKLEELKKTQPEANIINLGVGDIALPLAPKVASAIIEAVQQMVTTAGVHGYGPTEGYLFLRETIAKNEYSHLGISASEIFVSEGTNNDTANIQELFDLHSVVGVPDPTYPVYLDTNVMAGRGSKIIFLPCTKETGFVPKPPKEHCDLVYLCSPSNPTGVAMTKNELADWVAYAKREKAILLYDNAYAAFITSPDVPKSIFEVEGAKEVAIEFRSFSKSAGFTGLRCAYTVLPKTLHIERNDQQIPAHPLWDRRQATKTNGVAYPIQRGAEAVFSKEGKEQTQAQVKSYLTQGKALKEGLLQTGFECYGGIDAPYIWWKTPNGLDSWEFFDLLLQKCQLISIPGQGFGQSGEGYVRLSTFTTSEKIQEALNRIKTLV